jgi:hypothetical protein
LKKTLTALSFSELLVLVLICVGFIHWQSCDGDTTTTTTTLYSSPLAQITPAITVFGLKPAPEMASFSSQGPNSLVPDILKVQKKALFDSMQAPHIRLGYDEHTIVCHCCCTFLQCLLWRFLSVNSYILYIWGLGFRVIYRVCCHVFLTISQDMKS